MPFEIIPETLGVQVRFHGHITEAEALRSVEIVTSDPRFDLARYRINNLLDVQGFDVSEEGIERIAAVSYGGSTARQRRGVRVHIAQVATDPRLIAVLDRYAASGLVPYRFGTFPSLEAARAWLRDEGLDPAHDATAPTPDPA